MNGIETELIKLLKNALFGYEEKFDETVDFGDVLKEAQEQTVLPIVVSQASKEQNGTWQIVVDKLKAHFTHCLKEQTKLVKLLQSQGVPFVIIKGASAACYYPDPSTRTMGDVDVLVGEGYFDAAFALLKNGGYKFMNDYGDERDYSFTSGAVIFDLHKRYSDKGHDIESFLQEGIVAAKVESLYGNDFPVLPKSVNGLVLLDHIRHHIVGGLGLRQVIDFMLFVNSYKDEAEFERDVLPLFERAGLMRFAKVIAKTCKTYLGLPAAVKWCEGVDDKTCAEFLETVLKKGNFGRKDPFVYRPMENFTMSVKKNGFFKTLQTAGVANCKAFQKYKILRPFAWLYQLIRYCFKGVAAIFRKEKIFEDASAGREKADFYKRLGI